MLKTTALAYFNKSGRELATALNLSTVAVHKWGKVIPYWAAEEIERLSDGALKVRRELYDRGRPLKGKRLVLMLRSQQPATTLDRERNDDTATA